MSTSLKYDELLTWSCHTDTAISRDYTLWLLPWYCTIAIRSDSITSRDAELIINLSLDFKEPVLETAMFHEPPISVNGRCLFLVVFSGLLFLYRPND